MSGTSLSVLPAAFAFAAADEAAALPKNGQVQSGDVAISTPHARKLQIDQASSRAVIDWQSFDIEADEKVVIIQQADQSSLLNRIVGGQGTSRILGELVAGGRVVLVNPDGIRFGATARVDVGSLIATTASIGTDDFMNGRLDFDTPGNPDGRIVNEGTLTAAEGGLIALVAPGVANSGQITARLGRIALASGTRFTLDLYGDDLVRIALDGAVLQQVLGLDGEALEALITNTGALEADGGLIQISAAAADGAVDSLINLGGHVRARTVAEVDGEIVLNGAGGTVLADGRFDVRGDDAGERGGRVVMLGERVGLTGAARIEAGGEAGGGTVRIGGDIQGGGPLPTAQAAFVGDDVVIDVSARTEGDAGSAVIWADGTTRFHGRIEADGGAQGGDGGFVEVSGKSDLVFRGEVSTAAPQGEIGSLLLDPDHIVIADGSGGAQDAEVTGDGQVLFADGSGTFTISEQALEGIAAGTNITLQANTSITINNLTDDTLTLNQTGSVIFQTGASGFSMNTGDTIAMTGSGGDLNITVTGSGDITLGSVTLNNGAVSLTGDVVNIEGVTGAAALNFSADSGLTINGAVSASDTVIIDADSGDNGGGTFTIDSSGSLNSSGNDITVTASDVVLDGALNAGSANVTIKTSQTNATVALNDSGVETMTFSNAELSQITADQLIIGATSGDTNAGIDVQGLAVGSTTAIGTGVVLYAYTAGGDVTFSGSDSAFSLNLTAEAEDNISVTSNLSSSGGGMSFRADADADGAGTFSVATASDSLTTTNKNISIQASDITLGGSVSLGTGDLTILTSRTADGVGLGAATSNLSLDNDELGRITAANLVIGALSGSTTPLITVNGVTDAATDTISAGVTLQALGFEGDVNVSGTASVFNSGLELKAADRIHIDSVDLTSTNGSISFTADANAGGDSNNNVLFTGSRTITAGGAITLNASGGISGTADLTLRSNNGLTINNNLTNTSGNLSIDTDFASSDGVGTFTVPDGVLVDASGRTLTIVAADIDLGGSSGTRLSAADIVVKNSNNDGINIGTTSGTGIRLSDTELARITASNSTTFQGDATDPSAIIVDTVSDADGEALGSVAFDTTSSITFTGASQFDRITADADDGINVNGNLTADSNSLELDGDDDNAVDGTDSIAFSAGVSLTSQGGDVSIRAQSSEMSGSGNLTLSATGSISINDGLSLTGTLTATADSDGNTLGSFSIVSGETVNTNSNDVTITGNTAAITGSLNAGTGRVTMLTSSTTRPVALGAATAGTFSLVGSELANITTSELIIGAVSGTTNSTITVTGLSAANTANIGSLTLNAYSSEADIAFATSATTLTNGLTANAADQITFAVDLTTNNGNIALTADANSGGDTNNTITIASGLTLSAASSLSMAASGGITGAGTTTLTAGGGMLFSSSLTNTSGALTIDSDSDNDGTGTLTVSDNVLLDVSGQTFNITAGDIALDGSSGTRLHGATVNIRSSDNSGINLGTAASSINLTGTELARMLALTTNFGNSADNVSVTVGAISDAEAENLGTVNIDTAGSVTFSGASTFDALTVDADSGITVNANITTDTGDLSLDGDKNTTADGTDILSIASGITLDSLGDLTLAAVTGGIVTSGALTLNSAGNVSVQDDITLGGNLTVDADDDDSGSGNFSLTGGETLNSGNNNVTITANDFDIFSATAFNVGTGTLSISVSDAGTIGLASAQNMTIDATELGKITAGTLQVGTFVDPAGAITVSGLETSAELANIGNLGVRSENATIAVNGTTSVNGTLTLEAASGVTITGNTTASGAVLIDGDVDNSASGSFTLTSSTLNSSNNNVTVIGADYSTTATAIINAGTGTLNIQTSTTGRTIELGSDSNFGISATEFQGFTAANTVIGASSGNTTSAITVTGLTAANTDSAGTVSLFASTAGGDITFQTSASTFNTLNVTAADKVNLAADVTTDTGALNLTAGGDGGGTDHVVASGGDRTLAAETDLNFATPNGRTTASDAFLLNAKNDLVISNDITATDQIAALADQDLSGVGTLTIASGATLTSGASGNTAYGGADIVLAGSLSGTSAIFVPTNNAATATIGVTASGFNIDNDELSRVSMSTGTIFGFLGVSTPFSINGVTAAASANLGQFLVVTEGAVTFEGAASTFQNMQIGANDGVTVNVDITASGADGSISLDGDLENGATGNDGLRFADGVSLTAGKNVELASTTGGVSSTGSFQASAGEQIIVHDSFTGTGTVSLSAGTDLGSNDEVKVANGATLNSGNNAISISAGDLDLEMSGAIDAGSANLELKSNAAGTTIGLGGGSGTFAISTSELSRLTAANLLIGATSGTTNGTVTIDGLTAASTANISGALNVNALSDGADITFSSTASSFGAGAFNAEDDIDVNVNLTTTGQLILSADADGDGTGTLTVPSGVTVSSNNNPITVSSNNMSVAGRLNAGTAQFTFTDPTGAIVFGSGGLDNTTFDNIDFGSLTLGSTSVTSISIDGADAGDPVNDTETVTIVANGSTGSISFVNSASTFAALNVSAGTINLGTNLTTTKGALSLSGTTMLTAGTTLTTAGGNVAFSSSIDGNQDLTLNAGTGTVTIGGNVGDVTAPNTLKVTGSTITLENVRTVGQQLYTGSTAAAGSYESGGGFIAFAGNLTLDDPVTITSAGGDIEFDQTIAGSGKNLTLTAGSGNVKFSGNVGTASSRIGTLNIASAGNVTSTGSLYTGDFAIDSASGAVDLGFTSLDADGNVDISAATIEGKITGKSVILRASGAGIGIQQALQLFADTLDFNAASLVIEGLIAGSPDASLDTISAVFLGGGPYTFNNQDIETLVTPITLVEDMAIQVAANQVEDIVEDQQDELLEGDDDIEQQEEDQLDVVQDEQIGTAEDPLLDIVGSEEVADIDDEEDEDQEGGCGCG